MRRSALGIALLLVLLTMPLANLATESVRSSATAGSRAPSGVYYEIFVRSWYDTNGDGIGDLNGVTAKLDYLKSLGVSGIWLMPINPSPSYHGYDISNYFAINPQYGTLADFERLLRAAHQRGIKVIMDLVINHTSNRSPWFEAARDPHGRYHDWYTWATPAADLKAISATGGFAWHALPDRHLKKPQFHVIPAKAGLRRQSLSRTRSGNAGASIGGADGPKGEPRMRRVIHFCNNNLDPDLDEVRPALSLSKGRDDKQKAGYSGCSDSQTDSKQYYLGVFNGAMPDLNYDEPAVRKQMIEVGKFWLKKGVDGFRLDAAQHLYLDFDTDWGNPVALKKNLAWWREFHRGIDAVNPHAWLVGEVWQKDPGELAPWLGALDAVFNFPLAARLIESAKTETDRDLGATLERSDQAYRAAAPGRFDDAPLLSNHDTERVMSQLDGDADHMRVAAAMLLTLPGHPFIYYGEELGMRGEKPDPHLREPMRWYRAGKGPGEPTWEGWSAGDGPAVSVAAEEKDPDSLLNEYRMLIGWRRDVPALRDGVLHDWRDGNMQVAAWELDDKHGDVLVLHNLSGKPQSLALPTRRFHILLEHNRAGTAIAGVRLQLPPYGSAILQ